MEPPPPPDPEPAQTSPRRETVRLLVLGLGVTGVVALLHFTPLRSWLANAQEWKAHVHQFGWKAHAVFVVGSVVGIALGVPRLVLCLAGGALFGFVEGLIVAQITALLGSYGTFVFARWGGRDWALRKLQKFPSLEKFIRHPTMSTIFILRQLPVPGLAANLLLGLVEVSHRTFLIGSFFGYIPSNAIVSLIGSSMGKESAEKALGQVTVSLLLLAALSVVTVQVRKRMGADEIDS